MFKDYNKYLSASLKVYLFVLVIIFIMKIVGLDYFGLDVNNPILLKISNYLSRTHWGDVYNFTTIYILVYFYLCLATNKTKLYKPSLIMTIFLFISQCLMFLYYKMNWLYLLLCLITYVLVPIIVLRKITIKKQIKYIIIINTYELISLFIRNVGVSNNYGNFLMDSLLNIDQLLLLAITYNLHFMKGDEKICGVEVDQLSSLLKKNHYLALLEKFQQNYSEFNKLNKQDRATVIIYSILSLIWNIFTLVLILFMAKLNDTFIECIFIITSFWLSKRAFGKPFHLSSMAQCFIVSNLTYYTLNRITTPLGISILIPILLGVGLSYITSKFVKKTYKPLYKGMPKELFEETILKVTDKGSNKYEICYDFYINGKTDVSLSFQYNYSVAGIRKIKDRINEKIKGLE